MRAKREQARFESYIKDRTQSQNIPLTYLKLMILDILGRDIYEEFDDLLYYEQNAILIYCITTYNTRLSMIEPTKPTGSKSNTKMQYNDVDPAEDLDPRIK